MKAPAILSSVVNSLVPQGSVLSTVQVYMSRGKMKEKWRGIEEERERKKGYTKRRNWQECKWEKSGQEAPDGK